MSSSIDSSVDAFRTDAHKSLPLAPARQPMFRRVQLRTSIAGALGLCLGLTISPVLMSGPAFAGPAYKADAVVDFFAGKTRKICWDADPNCAAPPSASAAKFDLLVNFEFNSDRLTRAAKENLDQFAKALVDPRLKGQKFEIDGHTDATGAEQYNLGLSERRAASVVAYLASQGLSQADLVAKGFGKSKPRVADPFSPENRRVETHLLEQ